MFIMQYEISMHQEEQYSKKKKTSLSLYKNKVSFGMSRIGIRWNLIVQNCKPTDTNKHYK